MTIVLIYICVRDLRSHIISNKSILIFSVLLLLANGYEIRWIWGLITCLGLLIFARFQNLGGGDIKLITSLVLFADIDFGLIEYLEISMAVATLHLIFDYARKGFVTGNLALAPTICIPMLFSLAAR